MTLSGATILSQNGPGSNGNEGVLHHPPNSDIDTITLVSVIYRTLIGRVQPLCRDAVGVSRFPSRLSQEHRIC